MPPAHSMAPTSDELQANVPEYSGAICESTRSRLATFMKLHMHEMAASLSGLFDSLGLESNIGSEISALTSTSSTGCTGSEVSTLPQTNSFRYFSNSQRSTAL